MTAEQPARSTLICVECGMEFRAPRWEVKRGRCCCSARCAGLRATRTMRQRKEQAS